MHSCMADCSLPGDYNHAQIAKQCMTFPSLRIWHNLHCDVALPYNVHIFVWFKVAYAFFAECVTSSL